jgi:hypothetical protein
MNISRFDDRAKPNLFELMDTRKIMFIEKILVDPRLSLVHLNYRTLPIQKNTADLLVNGFELVGARGICIIPVEGNSDLLKTEDSLARVLPSQGERIYRSSL